MGACHEYALSLCGFTLKEIVEIFRLRKRIWKRANYGLLEDLPPNFKGVVGFLHPLAQRHIAYVNMAKGEICEDLAPISPFRGCREIKREEWKSEIKYLTCEELKRIMSELQAGK